MNSIKIMTHTVECYHPYAFLPVRSRVPHEGCCELLRWSNHIDYPEWEVYEGTLSSSLESILVLSHLAHHVQTSWTPVQEKDKWMNWKEFHEGKNNCKMPTTLYVLLSICNINLSHSSEIIIHIKTFSVPICKVSIWKKRWKYQPLLPILNSPVLRTTVTPLLPLETMSTSLLVGAVD